ncbi:MAG: glycosyltransferase [Acidobacteriota bacterium]|nr:glycosyltransferase [Acidobacteriota bacterium]
MDLLNLFYEEPQADRWFPLDHYPRKVIRRIVRGRPGPGGQTRVFLNLCAGLKQLGIPFRVNDFRHAARNPNEVVGILGKPQVLDKAKWKNPILFGAAIYSHPSDDPNLLARLPIRKILVPGEWMRKMCEPAWGETVCVWPVGIDTNRWAPTKTREKDIDVLLYDKIMWDHEDYERKLINPIVLTLRQKQIRFTTLRYGFYREEDFRILLARSRAMIFLCEHETQGIAYQQALSCDVPILAWDQGGYWQDPSYYPHKVKFSPVSSVPYWDHRCGIKFRDFADFEEKIDRFLAQQMRQELRPRDFILENLTLEKCAELYVRFYNEAQAA